jgi:hypothetical protein
LNRLIVKSALRTGEGRTPIHSEAAILQYNVVSRIRKLQDDVQAGVMMGLAMLHGVLSRMKILGLFWIASPMLLAIQKIRGFRFLQ